MAKNARSVVHKPTKHRYRCCAVRSWGIGFSISIALIFGGCSPAYQLSKRASSEAEDLQSPDVVRLTDETPLGLVVGSPLKRKAILRAALARYGMTVDDELNDLSDLGLVCPNGTVSQTAVTTTTTCHERLNQTIDEECPSKKLPGYNASLLLPATSGSPVSYTVTTVTKVTTLLPELPSKPGGRCVFLPTGSAASSSGGSGSAGGSNVSVTGVTAVPESVAAVIHAAADECVYWTYQENTTDLSASTWAQLLGIAVLGGGIYEAVKGVSTGVATVLTTTGAGVTLTSSLQKLPPSPVQSTVMGVIQAGLSYYPLIQAKALSGGIVTHQQKLAALSGLWDASGLGCGVGVFKGRGWHTKHE